MSGYWELQDTSSVLVGILHTDVTTIAWSFGLRNLQIPGPHIFLPVAGMPFDMARNVCCMRALEMGADFIFFLDSDVIPPKDAIPRLMKHGVPLISGVYARRSPPRSIPVMLKNGQWITPDKYKKGDVIEVDVVGAGCLLVRRDVLEKMKPQRPSKHWFDWRVDMQGLLPPGECLSEDFTFNVAVKRQLGIPTLVDTSIVCKHVGYAESLPGTFEPLECNPVT